MKKTVLLISFFLLYGLGYLNSYAQEMAPVFGARDTRDTIRVEAFITPEGDTIPQS